MTRRGLLATALLTGLAVTEAAAGWQAELAQDPVDELRRCLLRSDPLMVHDGYAQTRVQVVYNGQAFLLVADSPMDTAFGDLGVAVDAFPALPPARLAGDRIAVFDQARQLEERFRRGAEATFGMRFWPTWPSKGRLEIDFDLTGFSRALQQLRDCDSAAPQAARQ